MKMRTAVYVKNSVEAVQLYTEAFGLELGYHVLNPDGSFMHSELNRNGVEIFDVIEAPNAPVCEHIVQVNVILDSEDDVRHAFSLLSDGGTVDMPLGPLPWSPCAAVVYDRFGVWWYITAPQHYPDASYDPTAPWNPEELH